MTRLSQNVRYAGDRMELDAKAASLLALAAWPATRTSFERRVLMRVTL